METLNKLTPSWKPEEYEEYLNLKATETKRMEESKKEYHKYAVIYPESVFVDVPSSKKDEVIRVAKLDLIGQEMEKAKQQIIKINSPLKEKEISTLVVNLRNFHRQLVHFETQKRLMEKGTEVKDKEGKKFEMFDLLFILDKLKSELKLMKKELELYGLDYDDTIGK